MFCVMTSVRFVGRQHIVLKAGASHAQSREEDPPRIYSCPLGPFPPSGMLLTFLVPTQSPVVRD